MKKKTDNKIHIKGQPYPEEIRLQVIAEYFQGKGPKELAMKYNLSDRTLVTYWVRTFGAEPHKISKMAKAKSIQDETGSAKDGSIRALTNELKRMQKLLDEREKALKREELKNYALNTMIDLAEERLQIPIRKKSGTKQ